VATVLWWWEGLRALRHPRELFDGAPFSAPAWWAWAVLLPVAYLARDVQVVSRYLEVVLPVLLLLGLEAGLRNRSTLRVRRSWVRAALTLQIVIALALTSFWVAPRSRAFGRSLDAGLGDLSTWIRENTPPDALIAVYDIGYVGSHCDRRNRVDDAEILRQGLFLRFATPDYLIDRDLRPDALDGWRLPGYRLQAIMHRRVANLGLSRPEPVVYTIYRLLPL
jgi:hypothetical protein